MDVIEKRARELLAAEAERDGFHSAAAWYRDPSKSLRHIEAEAIRAIIATLTPPEGYVLVPVDLEQGLKMWQAGIKARNTGGTVEAIYAAMLAARPEVPHV